MSLILLALLLFSFSFVGVNGVQASDIREARKHAEEKLLPLEGIAGVSHLENPPTIIVYEEHEKYRGKVPSDNDLLKHGHKDTIRFLDFIIYYSTPMVSCSANHVNVPIKFK
jgi:hypothetical protein